MSCCSIIESDDKEVVGTCGHCEGDVNKDGQTVYDGCSYSPVYCEVCGDRPCDYSC